MRYETPNTSLLQEARTGAEWAWREIVRRYSPLIFAVCRRYHINGADAEDVGGSVWLRLVVNLATIREPEALPGWLRTTAGHECVMVLRHKMRQIPSDSAQLGEPSLPEFDAALIGAERRAVAREALSQLPSRDQQLLSMLFCDRPKPYKHISATLGIPVGAIGPTKLRCLARARRTPAIAALLDAERE